MRILARTLAVLRSVLAAVVVLAVIAGGAFSPRALAQKATPDAATAFPLTIENCGVDLTLNAAPQRVIVMDPAAVSILSEIGALDHVVARIGQYPAAYFSDEVNAQIAAIPELAAEKGQTGGAVISLETVLNLRPDLIIGYETETLTRDSLAHFGVGLYVIPPFCDAPPAVSFANVYAEVRVYGTMFDRADAAETAATRLEQQVAGALGSPVAHGERTAALYVAADGSAVYAYSRLGMVDVQMTALGLTNIYADLPERVAEISMESLISGDPEVLIILYPDPATTPEQITSLVTGLPGASVISAIKTGRVYPVLFSYSEPPSPLAVDGLSLLAELLAG